MRIRIPVGSADEGLHLLEDELGSLYLVHNPSEEFSIEQPGGAFLCVAAPETAAYDLSQLIDALASAVLELRVRESAARGDG